MQRSIVFAVLLAGLGCGSSSVDDACAVVVEPQCAVCFSCGVDGADACGLPVGSSESECVDVMSARCVGQAATLERPKRDVGTCEDSLPSLECTTIVRAMTQGTTYTTPQCEYFL